MPQNLVDITWALAFAGLGGALGTLLFVFFAGRLPAVFDKLTPGMDEGREIARGNMAAAEYFGRVVSAGIIGLSVIIGAAVLGGLIAGLL
ncbi:MAG: DUF350 domain-containing protein [Elusimicrobiales bacterium]|jgi:uncharacterized membrane protein YjfL (UPF0719 family)|nr:DUF350 domain-containing protein [Elusimicrobiales bacterium]